MDKYVDAAGVSACGVLISFSGRGRLEPLDDGDVGLRRRQQAFSMQLDAGAMHASLGVSLGKYESYPNDSSMLN